MGLRRLVPGGLGFLPTLPRTGSPGACSRPATALHNPPP